MVKYYIVIEYCLDNRVEYPYFYTCAKVGDVFHIIEDLEEYLLNGKGLSNKTVSGSYFPVDEYGRYNLS
jgi:hypothetical protein